MNDTRTRKAKGIIRSQKRDYISLNPGRGQARAPSLSNNEAEIFSTLAGKNRRERIFQVVRNTYFQAKS